MRFGYGPARTVRGERGKAGRVKITATGEGLHSGETTVTTK
jgi:hypothetical protein